MKYIKVMHVHHDQTMIIQNELTKLYYVIVEGCQNYSFSPYYTSKGYKSLNGVKKHFEHVVSNYKKGI